MADSCGTPRTSLASATARRRNPTNAALGCAANVSDYRALMDCDACVFVMPCGRSAHLELGMAIGAGKQTIALLADGEPELMLAAVDHLCMTVDEVIAALAQGHCGVQGQYRMPR